MAEVRAAGLTEAFAGRPILRGVDLVAPAGALLAILGSSGSGKTTLLRLLAGFERADAGAIEIGGQRLCGPGLHVPAEKRRIGYVAQEGALFPHLDVADNILFGLPRQRRRDRFRADALLDLVGLPASYARRAPHQLSGGEQQRVALARALAPAPRLVLLDEPFSSLDAALRVETRQAVAATLAATGSTALLVTHDQAEALSMGRQVAVLRDGAVAQVAAPEELYRRPVDAALAQFVGEAALLPGEAAGRTANCALGRLPLALAVAQGPVEVMVRPEQIRLDSPTNPQAVRARVLSVDWYGHDARVRVALESGGCEVAMRVSGHATPALGAEVWLSVEGAVMAYPFAGPAAKARSLPCGVRVETIKERLS